MFDTDDHKTGERGGSLLSLGRAIEDERARNRQSQTPDIPSHPDAVTRHQRARSKRESRPSPILDSLADAPAIPPRAQPAPASRPAAIAAAPATQPLPSEHEDEPSLIERLWQRRSAKQAQPPANDMTMTNASRMASTAAPPVPRQPAPRLPIAASPDIAAPGPAVGPRSQTIVTEPLPMSDTVVVMERNEEEGWKPLIDPIKVIGGITDSRGLIFATTLLGALLGAGLAIMTPKKYEAYAELLVDPRNLKLVDRELTDASGLPSDATLAIVENQVRVLTSSTVLNAVVDKMGLENDPEFNGDQSGFDLNPLNFVRALLTRSDGATDPARRRGLTVQTLAENIHVERTGKTFTILVGATAQSPQKAADIANTMISEFVSTAGKRLATTVGKASDDLTDKLGELRRNVEIAERKVEAFKAENDIIDAQGRLITDDEIVKLNDQLSIAKARTLELNGRAASARNLSTDDLVSGASPEAAASGIITELRSQYATAKQEADRLSVRLGPRHPQYQAAQAQVEGARQQIGAELNRIKAQVQTELRRAVQLEQELAARLAQLKVRQGNLSNEMVTLRELERDAMTQRSVYEAYLLRARETGEQKNLNTDNISVISDAQPPLESSGPSRAVVTGAGAVLGLLAGITLGGGRGALESLRETTVSRRRRTAAVRRHTRPEPESQPARVATAKPQTRPVITESKTAEPTNVQAAVVPDIPAEDTTMTSHYPTPGYYPQPAPANGYPAAPQAPYPQPAAQPYPVAPQGYPQPQAYAPQAYAPQGYPQPQPGYPAAAYPQPQGWMPAQPQQFYPQPMPPQPQPYAPYGAPAVYPQAPYPPAQGYAPAPQYTPPQQQPAAPQASAQDASDGQAVRGSLSEIKESIREFRDAVRELTESRTRRRYF